MDETGGATLFMHGQSQAVRLPKGFRLPGDRVHVRRVTTGVTLEPMIADVEEWFAALDQFRDVPLLSNGRDQAPLSTDDNQIA